MLNNETVLAIIPARGGSKGVPRKNIRIVGGKPLIAWTIDAAKSTDYIDRVILSTDDEEIAGVARTYNCDVPFMREPYLANDTATTMDVVIDTIQKCSGYDWVVVLQPTSPLRTSTDISNALQLCHEKSAPACVSVTLTNESPYWMYLLNPDASMQSLLPQNEISRRQDLPQIYSLNGAVYIARINWLLQNKKFVTQDTVAYNMPSERSIDLDTELDLRQLQILMGDL